MISFRLISDHTKLWHYLALFGTNRCLSVPLLRQRFDTRSTILRQSFDNPSTSVRPGFDKPSAVDRTAAEALPNKGPACPESAFISYAGFQEKLARSRKIG